MNQQRYRVLGEKKKNNKQTKTKEPMLQNVNHT